MKTYIKIRAKYHVIDKILLFPDLGAAILVDGYLNDFRKDKKVAKYLSALPYDYIPDTECVYDYN